MRGKLTVLLPAETLFAFGSGCEVRVADGLVDEELLLLGGRHSLGGGAREGGAFTLLYQAGKTGHMTIYHMNSCASSICDVQHTPRV